MRVLIAAFSGFVAGVAVGLLVAPASGTETRQRIADSAGELAGGVKEKIRKFRNKAGENLNDLGVNVSSEKPGGGM